MQRLPNTSGERCNSGRWSEYWNHNFLFMFCCYFISTQSNWFYVRQTILKFGFRWNISFIHKAIPFWTNGSNQLTSKLYDIRFQMHRMNEFSNEKLSFAIHPVGAHLYFIVNILWMHNLKMSGTNIQWQLSKNNNQTRVCVCIIYLFFGVYWIKFFW